MADSLQGFLFDELPVRGAHVHLRGAFGEVVRAHHYPPQIASLLGEFMASIALLGHTMKRPGSLILQARSEGELGLIMAETDEKLRLRAIARNYEQSLSHEFTTLLADGRLALTLIPEGGERYQGVVELAGENLAQCLGAYFHQSEQLQTRFLLATGEIDGERCSAGLMLQELPHKNDNSERWEHLNTLLDTVGPEELISTPAETLLHRLFHEETVRVFDPKPCEFYCSCSAERIGRVLAGMGQSDIDSLLAEQDPIESTCEFCNRQYLFSRSDIEAVQNLPTRH